MLPSHTQIRPAKRRLLRQSRLRRKLGVVSSYFLLRPFWCTWQVTYRCNFRCTFCNYWHNGGGKPEQPIAAFEAGGRKLVNVGNMMISLAGGEPLMRRDIVDIVAVLSQWHLPMITTNGWLVTRELASDLWRAGLYGASVSIDFASSARHDAERGVSGAFDRAVSALEHLASTRTERRQKVNLMAVLRNDNLDQVEPLLALAKKIGVHFMVQPYSAVKTGDLKFLPPPGCARTLVELRKRHRNFLSNVEFLARFDEAINGGIPGCVAGRAFFNVDTNGDVSRCVEFRGRPVANLTRDPVNTIMRRLRRCYKNNNCRACWFNCRGEVEVMYSRRGLINAVPKLLGG
jgi:MoaA/NifB/PqqE/SkfB family radical SAM enzyme